MPVAIDDPREPRVTVSAPAELVWVLLWVQHSPEHKMPAPLEPVTPFDAGLVDRVQGFWADGCRVFSELLVLAHASGHLFDADVDPFLQDLAARMPELGELRLRSETPADQAIFQERLRRLRADARLRRRYVALLRETWAVVREAWQRDGLRALEASARQLAGRAARAADPLEIVPELVRCAPPVLDFLRAAYRAGEVVLSPNYFGGWYLVLDLPGLVLVGMQPDLRARADTRRHEMEVLAAQLRVLADPTRLAILADVAEKPANVTELQQLLQLAQPTVSAHVRLLRESGLLRARRQRGRTDYQLDRDRLDELLRAVGAALPASC